MNHSKRNRKIVLICLAGFIFLSGSFRAQAALVFKGFGGLSFAQCDDDKQDALWGGSFGVSTDYVSFTLGGLLSNCDDTVLFAEMSFYFVNMGGFKAGVGGTVDFAANTYQFVRLRPEAVAMVYLMGAGSERGPNPYKYYPTIMASLEARIGWRNESFYGTLGLTIHLNPNTRD